MREIIEQFFNERNSSTSTRATYTRSIRYYEELTSHTIEECLAICEQEETQNIRWKNTQTRKWILEYRELVYTKYNVSTAQLYLTAIITVYRHFELTIPPLPYYSTKHSKRTPPINYNDLPDRELISECLQIATPLARAILLFMSSSGMSRIDLLNLTIKDYLEATSDFHSHQESVKYAIKEMLDKDIVPTFHLTRQKTGQKYFAFCSHEATKSINTYLLTRTEILRKESPLFKINPRYLNMIFERLSGYLQLEKMPNGYNRLTPHMLRRYNATQLAIAGMSTEHIDLIQGRKIQGVAYESYIHINPKEIRDRYIECLPYLVIEDINKFKTENQLLKEENAEYKQKEEKINDILKRLEKLESM